MNEHKLEQEVTQLVNNYDIVSVISQFHQLSYENTGKMFTGPLIIVMYPTTKQNTVETLMGEKMDICLEGWIPDHDGNKSQYDFLITLNTPLLNIVSINNILSPIKKHIHILPLDIAENDKGMMTVSIHMTALLELKNLPTPVLN